MVFKVKSSSVFSEPIPHQLITAARNQRFVNNIVIIFAKMYTLTGISTLLHIGQKIVNRVPRLVSCPIILLFIVVFKYHWFKFGIQILVRMLRHNIRAYTVNRWVWTFWWRLTHGCCRTGNLFCTNRLSRSCLLHLLYYLRMLRRFKINRSLHRRNYRSLSFIQFALLLLHLCKLSLKLPLDGRFNRNSLFERRFKRVGNGELI